MINKIRLQNILFLDIETVPEFENFTDLDTETQNLFEVKTAYQRKDEIPANEFYERAGIWAEFGKIICISVGYFNIQNQKREFRIKSFSGNETKILQDFYNLLQNHFNEPQHILCGHNAKEFDIPFLGRRYLINHINLPDKLNLMGKKPWEVPILDTLEMWKFGDYKHFTSLKLLTHVLGIPSPKDDIDGSQVANVYYQEKYIDRIVRYCEKDVIATAQVMLRLRNEPLLTENEVEIK
ncbi:3'-5' exonuclease [Flavobacterium agricola]|uniref:3'-5' exonuclease n=1 Tax=Flavobacterium agricola TaxID=2870839 RepID=A0ABY6LX77_9FLAO|nr:3'-5' exonuclease [Flavobacterium agricola]UYW00935.1 3'-5' exonuclease [Flavobacterium agricola]